MQPLSVVSTLDLSGMPPYSLQRPRMNAAVSKTKQQQTRQKPRRDSGRVKRASQLYNLTLDINDLKQEIRSLALRRQSLQTHALYESRLSSDCSVVRKAAHYLQSFAHGYRGRQTHASQDAYVRSIASENFSIGVTGLGVDMLLEQWRVYTELFHLRETMVRSMELLTRTEDNDDAVIKSVLDFHGVFTRDAVNMIFPSASREPQLLLRLLGRKMVCPIVFHLYFNTRGQLVRHDADADFFSAVRRALGGDCNTAARLMDALRLGQEGIIGPTVEETDHAEPTEQLQSSEGYETSKVDLDGPIVGQEPDDVAEFEIRAHDKKLEDTEAGGSNTQRHSLAFLLSNVDA